MKPIYVCIHVTPVTSLSWKKILLVFQFLKTHAFEDRSVVMVSGWVNPWGQPNQKWDDRQEGLHMRIFDYREAWPLKHRELHQ